MKLFSGFSTAAVLLLLSAVAQAGPVGPFDVTAPGDSEYRVDAGAGYFRQGGKVRSSAGEFDLTRNEVFGTIRYTGYDWSVGGRLGGATLDEKSTALVPSGESRSEGFKPMIGLVVKGLIFSDTSGDFGVGATVQANRYLFDHYQDYYNVALAITAQQRWGRIATLYGGPFLSVGGGRRKGTVTDNNGLVLVDYAKDTPLGGLCLGFSFVLPKSVGFDVEIQYTGLNKSKQLPIESSDWGVGAGLRVPLWY